jgi:hypothetical protein
MIIQSVELCDFMPQPKFFDNPIYFRLFYELAEFDLVKELPLKQGNNGFWGSDEITRPFNSALRKKMNMNKKEKTKYLLMLIDKTNSRNRNLSSKIEIKRTNTIASRYFRKMNNHIVLKDVSAPEQHKDPNYCISWDGVATCFINRVSQQFKHTKFNLSTLKPEIITALKTHTFYSHRFCKAGKLGKFSLNNFFDRLIFIGISDYTNLRKYNNKNNTIEFFFNDHEKKPQYTPHIPTKLSFELFKIFLDYSLLKSGNYITQEP